MVEIAGDRRRGVENAIRIEIETGNKCRSYR